MILKMYGWCLSLCIVFFLHSLDVDAFQSFDWAYGGSIGPSTWKYSYVACGGSHQSPINIVNNDVKYDTSLKPFVISLNKSTVTTYDMRNLGLNTEIFFGATQWDATFDGYRDYCYRIAQMHFHWGSDNSQGSEHTIDGQRFPLEAHYVMWNCRAYKTFAAAASGVNGLAVMGVLYEVDETVDENPVLNKIVNALSDPVISQCPCKTDTDIASIQIKDYDVNPLLPKDRSKFYRYRGSLTTPPCTENVLWTVFKERMKVSGRQLELFRSLLNRKNNNGGIINMVNNFRPVHPLNPKVPINSERVVTASFRPVSGSAKTYPAVITILLSVTAFLTSW